MEQYRDDHATFDEKAAYLENSLIYQMSLGSKELFHSNVWAWLIEQDARFIGVFFPDFDMTAYELCGVSRESYHRDIIIWLKKKGEEKKSHYLVIENKIKSLQQKEQLREYSEDLDKCVLLEGAFTGIENTLADHIQIYQIKWTFVRYEVITARIRKIMRISDICTEIQRQQIEEYCCVIECIHDLLHECLKETEDRVIFDNDTIKQLQKLRIKDIYTKLKGNQMLQYIKSKLSDLEKTAPNGFTLYIGQSFSHGHASLDYRYTNYSDHCDDYLIIGVQLEGDQYRLLAEKSAKRWKADALFGEFGKSEIGWFDSTFDEKAKNRRLCEHTTYMKRKYNSYSTDRYNFVYQHFDIKNWPYDQLVELIRSDLKKSKRADTKTTDPVSLNPWVER